MICSVVDYGRPRPPHTPEELIASTASLCVPEVHRLLRASRPISEVSVFANTQNRWRRYGLLPWFPEGLVILGDAVCALNPRYGQGMTLAALGADRLDRDLGAYFAEHHHLRGFSHRFQKNLEEVLQLSWQIATMEDRMWVAIGSGGPPSLADRLRMGASGRVLRTVFSDLDTYVQFMRVAHLLDAPTGLLHPKVIAALARRGDGGRPPAPPPHVGSVRPEDRAAGRDGAALPGPDLG
jgi:2-polyprenyl-6-methoxyphenol hydroxylase-like FAD-dependent oxidoreductase